MLLQTREIDELRRNSQGVIFEGRDEQVAPYSTDFGLNFQAVPRAVVLAANAHDVQVAMQFALEMNLPFKFRGNGFSSGGQTLCDGVVIRKPVAFEPPRMEGSDFIADGAAKWIDVIHFLAGHDREPPVVTSFLEATVAGTLSVGGYGAESIVRGTQVDHVTAIEVITEREILWVGRDHPLFSKAIAGVGKGPFINAVKMATVKRSAKRELLHVVKSSALEAAETIVDLHNLYGHVDSFMSFSGVQEIASSSWRLHLGCRGRSTGPTVVQNNPSIALDQQVKLWLQPHTESKKLWADYIVGGDGLQRLSAFVDESIPSLRPWLHGVYFLVCLRDPNSKLSPTRYEYGIGTYFMLPEGAQKDAYDGVSSFLMKMQAITLSSGGRVYPYGFHG